MNTKTRFALLLGSLATFAVVSVEAQALPQGVTQAMITQGKEIYAKSGLCFACHGPEGKGLVGPSLTDDVWLHSKGTYEEIVHQTTVGVTAEESKSKVPMPAKGGSSITDDEIKAVSAYVWSLSKH
ncbi:MAG: cytochrome c [Gemmatimonadales bacterium]|jgi:cytochrome c oxidase cbb3-type subunit 3|nr:MAG: cytochrome c [Gemmatimonadales bacterium]